MFNLHGVFCQRKLRVLVCVGFLGTQSMLSQSSIASERGVVEALAISTLETTFDSTLLLRYFNLDLDDQIAQKMRSNGTNYVSVQSEWKPKLIVEIGPERSLILSSIQGDTVVPRFDALEGYFSGFLETDFSKKEKEGVINPLPAELKPPSLVQPPTQSNIPDPLSLLMLSMGGIALLGWSRQKRSK